MEDNNRLFGYLDLTLLEIITEFKDGDNTPLDGDEVDKLCEIIKAKINLQEGNITDNEYEKIIEL